MDDDYDDLEVTYCALTVEDTIDELGSDINGLSEEEVKRRLEKFGYHEIPEKRTKHPIVMFFRQFNNLLIYILIVAALISFIFEHLIDVYVISAVILINAMMGFIQEHKAEKSIQALKKNMVLHAKVYREGKLKKITSRELVPGDIILLENGDKVPADARLIDAKNIRTVEAFLTGEALPVEKEIKKGETTFVTDCKNTVWMGALVVGGQAKAVVTATGMNTIIGKLARNIEKIKKEKGHFEKKVDTLAKQMGIIAAIGALVTFLVGLFIRVIEFGEIFLFTIASLVSGIPEGLPAVLVIVLAMGAHKMARRNVIVRALPASETLGVTNVIATDKTGTLTQNTMTVKKIILPKGDEITVSGSGWEPIGDFLIEDKIVFPSGDPDLSKLLHIAAICNNADLLKKQEEEKVYYDIIGDPTEAALLVLAEKAGLTENVVQKKVKRIDDLPFNPEFKFRASLTKIGEENPSKKEIYIVGAPETILNISDNLLENNITKELTEEKRQEILNQVEYLSKEAMRVIALAYIEEPAEEEYILSEDLIYSLIFVGIVGMRDPPRPEVKEAIAKTKKAGIRVVMKTGDHKTTAIAIAKEIGLIDGNPNPKGKYPQALTEQELLELPEKEFEEIVKNVNVFARLTPNMKLRLVETLQKQGNIVAMTGDGVNDAPALKKADIGIAMGRIGTDVARESSEIVLADDNFASIVDAVEEGRIVFENIRHASTFLITTSLTEDLIIILGLVLGFPLILLPIQILYLNLVVDGVSDVAIAAEPGHGEVLELPPKKKEENILTKRIIPFLLIIITIMASITAGIFMFYLPQSLAKARTVAFAFMAMAQLFNVLNMRSFHRSVFNIGFFSNKYVIAALAASSILLVMVIYTPFLQSVFQFAPLSLIEILIITLLSSSIFWFGEMYKLIKKGLL